MAFTLHSAAPCAKLCPGSLATVVKRSSSCGSSQCLLTSHLNFHAIGGSSASSSRVIVGIGRTEEVSWPNWQWLTDRGRNRMRDGRMRSLRVHAALATETSDLPKVEVGHWNWAFEGKSIKIHFTEYLPNGTDPAKTLLLLPTISDVSTVAEWQDVAEGLVKKGGYRIVAVDWPGLGFSDRPLINYTADALEQFLADFVAAADIHLGSAEGGPPVIIGAGHAATIAARALSKGLIQGRALAAVAPTWAGPLPIVFGRAPNMEFRYKLLRETLRSQGVGWATYKYLVSSPKNIRLQYLTHVYADEDNVTPAIVENRTALTQRDGARYAPAAFLTGLLDPTTSREELLEIFAKLDGKVPTLVLSSIKGPRRSRAEMDALEGVQGVTKFSKVPGALLPHEEYPESVTDELLAFLQQ